MQQIKSRDGQFVAINILFLKMPQNKIILRLILRMYLKLVAQQVRLFSSKENYQATIDLFPMKKR